MTGEKVHLPYDEVDIMMAADQEPRFSVSMTEEAIQNVAEFEQDGLNDYRLASEMIGTTASFMNSDQDARIRDIVVDDGGTVQYAVISDPLGDDLRQLKFDRIEVEQGDGGGIVINASKADMETMPMFSYEQETETSYDSDSMDSDVEDDSDMTTPQ